MEPMQEPVAPQAVDLRAIINAVNIADMLPDDELAKIAENVMREHRIDHESMSEWRGRMERGIKLASLVKEEKSYPFDKAANVKYPLITTAALQFNARAYPAIVPPTDVVKVRVFGQDPQGTKAARAKRVADFMSWQLSSQVEEWEESVDEMLTMLPIVGTVVRKVWFDPAYARPRVRMLKPDAFIINAAVRSLPDAPRLGEILPLYPSEIAERVNAGLFRDIEYTDPQGNDPDTAQEFIEQHRRIDLDGDGYAEPYIVTVCKEKEVVARIVADFTERDVVMGPRGITAIQRGSYFVPYHFLPPIDGGFFGTGLGFLLGDISESINTVINMMIDAGHMASRGGGFLGSEFRIKGGSHHWRPGEWKMMEARGGDIRSAVVPMTFPGPDATLFQLLGLLIDAGRDVSSVKDVITGDTGGRQMTATTTLALIEQGMAQFTAAYKRIFRSLKREFKLFAKINAETLDAQQYSIFHDQMQEGQMVQLDPKADFRLGDVDIEPVADPQSVTKMQEAAKAQIVLQMAEMGMVDQGEAATRVLHAAGIPDVEKLTPKPNPAAQMMEQMGAQAAQADLTLKMIEVDQALADIEKTRSETIKNLSAADVQEAQLRLDRAKMMLEAVRDGIGTTLGGSLGGMAMAPRYGNAAGLPMGQPRPPAPSGNVGLLGGQAVAGGGQGVAPAIAGPV